MHLKSLTLRGFKSFASATTLRFEPGITCVVGPNGAGKSNVVDALAWVMGEQGAKSLRGGKMDDVIFAGTAARPPLGRAEVVLTIDNSDGALPIDYAEVTISRLMFRSGQSEYAVNGTPCRLLDIQELLSDSGIGREMHVVVGQGQLDAVLAAAPEERRAFVEEAAGVLKHRKRKEKALRKLEAMAANLARLTDLSAELRRQLTPLGRQAEVARRAAVMQAERRDARLRLLADDLLGLESALAAELADEAAARNQRAVVEEELAAAQVAQARQEQAAVSAGERLGAARDTWYRLQAVQERLHGTAALARERHRHLSGVLAAESPGRDPDELDRDAALAREQTATRTAELARSSAGLQAATAGRMHAEQALAEAEQALVAAIRATADRREGLARLAGQLAAARSRVAAGEAELGRLAETAADARLRADQARAELTRRQADGAGLEAGEVELDRRHESALADLAASESRLAALMAQERDADRDRSTWAARHEALAVGLARKDGAGALLGSQPPAAGMLGSVVRLLRVQPGAEAAVAAALGRAADAVAMASLVDAAAALTELRETDAGQATLWIARSEDGGAVAAADGADVVGSTARPELPTGVRWVRELVAAPPSLSSALTRMLDRVALVPTLADGVALVSADPTLRAVTRGGDLLGVDCASGGSAGAPSLLELQAAVDEAASRLGEATSRAEQLRGSIAAARMQRDSAQVAVAATEAALHESDARMAALTEQLALLGSTARSADGEVTRITAARATAEQDADRNRCELAALAARLSAAEQAPPAAAEAAPSPAERDRLAVAASQARAAEVEARLAVRSAEERVKALAGRAESLARSAVAGRAARARLAAHRVARARGAANAAAVGDVLAVALERVAASLTLAAAQRSAAEAAGHELDRRRSVSRARIVELTEVLARVTDVVHRDEVARAEQQLRIEALRGRAGEEFGVSVEVLRTEYGPDVPVPPPVDAGPDARPTAYDRNEQERRAEAAERALARLGRVNPLALEEYAALEERHAFLTAQLADLHATRRDLLSVVREVDQRIHEVFAAAFADTAREFEAVFGVLFPGGEGRLVLTDPTDLLSTGIEVEARPPGKKVKRLSLLSGGERSLTAIALLVAIFRARPSPFYVLDEVEAALDDVNLSRLLDLISSLRETSQLIVITHQKRTMEIADALYGVSMRGDGITSVISQRLREREPA